MQDVLLERQKRYDELYREWERQALQSDVEFVVENLGEIRKAVYFTLWIALISTAIRWLIGA